jgi:hypothetical protein
MKGTHPLRDFFFGSLTRVIITVLLSILLFALVLNACSPAPQYAPPVAQVQQGPVVAGQAPVIVQQAPQHDGFMSGFMMGHLFSGGYGYRAPVVVQHTIIAPTVVRPTYVAPRAIVPSYTPRPSAWTSTNSRGISTTTSRSSISVGRRR